MAVSSFSSSRGSLGRSCQAQRGPDDFIGLGSDRTQILNNVAQRDGFDIDSDNNFVVGNTATEAPTWGFLIFQANNNTFIENRAVRCDTGFVASGSEHGNRFTANVALNNANNGFNFGDGTFSNSLDHNTASGNAAHGFAFDSVSRFVSEHDEAIGNGAFGFSLFRTTASSFTHDVSHDNQNGFVAAQSAGNTFVQDVANHNGDFGFVLYDGATANTVERSVAHANPVADATDDAVFGANSWIHNSFGTSFIP
jgi:parallel beta-helix repeat protein